MNRILMTAGSCLLLATMGAHAQTTAGSNANANSASGSQSGNSFNQRFNTYAPSVDLGRTVPAVIAPSLTTTLSDTCHGSSSVGVSAVSVGVTLGSTWKDESCIRRLDARQMAAMGDMDLAKEIMCGSDEVRAAALRVGRPCRLDAPGHAAPVASPKPVAMVPPPPPRPVLDCSDPDVARRHVFTCAE